MRHGWQMCALLIDFFGSSGKVEAQKMLERRAFENARLLGTFNVDVDTGSTFSPTPTLSIATENSSSRC